MQAVVIIKQMVTKKRKCLFMVIGFTFSQYFGFGFSFNLIRRKSRIVPCKLQICRQ